MHLQTLETSNIFHIKIGFLFWLRLVTKQRIKIHDLHRTQRDIFILRIHFSTPLQDARCKIEKRNHTNLTFNVVTLANSSEKKKKKKKKKKKG